MKKKIFTLLLAIVASVGTMKAIAEDGVFISQGEGYVLIRVGALYYEISNFYFDGNTAHVTYTDFGTQLEEPSNSCYPGLTEANILASVTYNGTSYPVTAIHSKAFLNCTTLQSVTIPNSVTYIDEKAFSGCTNLAHITMPDSVTVEDAVFEGCTSLPVIDNIRYADTYLVEAVDKSLSAYSIKEGTKMIGHRAFVGCNNMVSVTIPNTVTSIGKRAFINCSSLTSVTIPNHVTYSTKQWGEYTVLLSNYDFQIGEYAFSGCTSLTSVEFFGVAGELPIFDYEDVKPGGIGKYAFSNCNSLSSITLPNGANIGENAFCECENLSSVTIPGTLYSIWDEVFRMCTNLANVYVKSKTPVTIYGYPFESTNDNLVIHVPFGATEAYKSTKGWRSLNIQAWVQYSANTRSTSTVLQFDAEDVELQSCCIEGGEPQEGNILEYIGLEPASEYNDIPVILTSNTGETETITVSFSTTALELTTQPSKPVSSTTAILLANTNMADAEVSCGFEWKRNDAPADMAGTKVYCPVANGTMAGRLKNLKDDTYYKYRAFYQSSAGNMYYGDWQYIFTGDNAVEFDPVLYTYAAAAVTETTATLKGYALAGSDDFTEQGFEYWAESRVPHADNAPARMPAALGEHQTVQTDGISMRVTLTDLDEGTIYKYRTYVKMGSQTVYGSEMSFTTKGEYTGTEALDPIESSSLQGGTRKILRDGQVLILRGDKTYTLTGQEVR